MSNGAGTFSEAQSSGGPYRYAVSGATGPGVTADGSAGQPAGAARQAPLSVSAALSLAKGALEGVTVRLVGEVSEVSNKPGYKAVYFTVKDASAALPCMMWNNRYRSAGVELRVGMLVELAGRFTLYAAKGRMNFDVFSISLAGEGNLRLQVANLARKLQAEGLMDPARKRPVPVLPQRVGIVTSPRGAVVHDMLRTLRRRCPMTEAVVAGVPVEGANAPLAMIEGLRAVVAAGVEVILLGRGGGSFEDLMPFNDERLARTIAACPVPIVTGIGHEPDVTIADMVADIRASTPTGAAEAVVPDRAALAATIDARQASLAMALARRLDGERHRLEALASRPALSDPQSLFSEEALTLDLADARIRRVAARENERRASELSQAAARLELALPRALDRDRAGLERLADRALQAGRTLLDAYGAQLALAASRLDDLSPLAVLARGYAVARDEKGHIMKSVEGARSGDAVTVMLEDGTLACTVDAVERTGRRAALPERS